MTEAEQKMADGVWFEGMMMMLAWIEANEGFQIPRSQFAEEVVGALHRGGFIRGVEGECVAPFELTPLGEESLASEEEIVADLQDRGFLERTR